MAFAAPAAGAAARGVTSKVASGAGQAAAQAATVKSNTKKVVKATKTSVDTTRKTTRNIISNSKRSWEPRSVGGYRRIITALFVVSALIVIYKNSKNERWSGAQPWRRLGAVWFIYFVFGIASTAGVKVARICALLGGLITLSLVIQNKELLFGATSALRGFGGTAASNGGNQDGGLDFGNNSTPLVGPFGGGTIPSSTSGQGTSPLIVNGQVTDRTKVFLTEANTPANVPTAASNPGGTPSTTPATPTVVPISFNRWNIDNSKDLIVSGYKIRGLSAETGVDQAVAKAKNAKAYFEGNFISADGKLVNIQTPVQGVYRDKNTGWTWSLLKA